MADEYEQDGTFRDRLHWIAEDITLGMRCSVLTGWTEGKGHFVQISCVRIDVITGVEGVGRGGKAYPSEHATDSEIIQMIFGLYMAYWTHEARENFQWRGRRVFGPHISTEALWEVAQRVDVRSALHIEDSKSADDRPNAGLEAWADRYMEERGIEPTPEGESLADRVARGEA